MCGDGLSQRGIRQTAEHRNLYTAHDFAGPDAESGKSENLIAVTCHKTLKKAPCFHQAPGAQNRRHGDFEQPIRDSLLLCFRLAQPDTGKFWIGEKAEGHLPASRNVIAAENVIANDPEVIFADVGKMRAAGDLSNSPDAGRRSLD